jgi:hypothetical protein
MDHSLCELNTLHLACEFSQGLLVLIDSPILGSFQSSICDKTSDSLQFPPIKPDSVRLAFINDDTRDPGEVLSVHQCTASNAGDILQPVF